MEQHFCFGAYTSIESPLGVGDLFHVLLFPGRREVAELFDLVVTPSNSILIANAHCELSFTEIDQLRQMGWGEHEYATKPNGELIGISLSPLVDEIVPTSHWPFWSKRDIDSFAEIGVLDSTTLVIPNFPEDFITGDVPSLDAWRVKRRKHAKAESPSC